MEFGKYSKMTVSDVAKSAATEGGAVIAGLIGAGVLGKQVEKLVKPSVKKGSPMLDKAIAWTGNNGSKLLAYYLLRKEGGKMLKGYEVDIGKGVLGSVVLDTLVRFDNDYIPLKSPVKLFGIAFLGDDDATGSNVTPQMQENMQKVLQENSSLRQQLNGALQRVASNTSPVNVNVTPIRAAATPDQVNYGVMPPVSKGDPRYGNMTPSQKKYGQMNDLEVGVTSLGSHYGMD